MKRFFFLIAGIVIGALVVSYFIPNSYSSEYEEEKKAYSEKIRVLEIESSDLAGKLKKSKAASANMERKAEVWKSAYKAQEADTKKAFAYSKKVKSPGFEIKRPELILNLTRFEKALILERKGRTDCEEREKALKLSLFACEELCGRYAAQISASRDFIEISDTVIKKKKKKKIWPFLAVLVGGVLIGRTL